MLQRIQTLYLLLVIICLALVFVFPFATYTLAENKYMFTLFGFEFNGENKIRFPFYVAISVVIGLALFTIAKYKNRPLQMKMGRINYLLLLVVIALSFVNVRTIEDSLGDTVSVSFGAGLFLPVAALAFLFLANRGIKKDEELIKSLDRLR